MTNQIVLYDAMSYLRVRLETEKPQDVLRGALNETQNPYGMRIWVWDGIGGNAKRRAIFPPYKTSREKKPGVMQAMDFIRELIGLTNAWQIRLPGFEGDDVVAALTHHFFQTTNLPISIQCRDADLAALCALDPRRITCSHAVKIPYHDIPLYKLTFGDNSDDIPGIKGFGQKGWDACDRAGLGKLIYELIDQRRPLQPHERERALAVGLRPGSCTWLESQENIDALGAMKRCIDPLPIDMALIDEHLKQGENDWAAINAKLAEFML